MDRFGRVIVVAGAVLLGAAGCDRGSPPSGDASTRDDSARAPATATAIAPAAAPAPPVSFLGVEDRAERIVFLCDRCATMLGKFDLLRLELRRTVERLPPGQSFAILFPGDELNENAPLAMGAGLLTPSADVRRRVDEFLDRVAPAGYSVAGDPRSKTSFRGLATEPVPAVARAFALRAQVLYLVTDGDFVDNRRVLEEVRRLNADKSVRVHTISFIDPSTDDEHLLERIARENGGRYRQVQVTDLAP